MKISALALLLASSASAFVVVPSRPAASSMALNSAPAKSKEEDLALTREVIVNFMGGDAAEEPAKPEPEKKKKKDKKKKDD